MCADFNQHAMKARKKYYGNWFEITGALGETDMDGKYFYLESADKAIKCIIPKSTREKVVDKLTQAERGDIITVKGKVTDIGQSEYYEVTTADVYPNSSATTAASEEYDIASEEVSSRNVEHSGNAASEEADSKTASTTQDNGRDIHDEEEQKASDMTPEESSSTPAEDTKVFSYVDQMPIFPGGESALMNYIASNLKYPSAAQDQGIQGLVMLRFVVTGTGEVGEVQVLKSLDPSCDREAIRVVKSLPRFTPGRQQGKPVNVWFQLPVRFELR
jgi:protein TonB